jgi:hypothetical protein
MVKLTLDVSTIASLISSQHGPLILRFNMNNSSAEVFVPKARVKVFPLKFLGKESSIN